jgi:Zn finger protein HypA/HybF involved in hydrogenase expression
MDEIKCIKCRKYFKPEWEFNRLCPKCNQANNKLSKIEQRIIIIPAEERVQVDEDT